MSSFIFLMETTEQGEKAGLTSVSPAMGVGRQPGQASGPRTWKEFQVLYFRQHNRSVMYFYPQAHSEHHVCINSAGIHPDYLSVYTGKQPEADLPRRQRRWLPDVAYPSGSLFGWWPSSCLLGPGTSARHEPQHLPQGPSAPHQPPGPVLCWDLGSCGRGEAVGRDGEEEGNGLQTDRRRGEKWGLLPVFALSGCSSQPRGYSPRPTCIHFSKRKALRCSLALNLCCSPRWENPELTQAQPAEVTLFPASQGPRKHFPALSVRQIHLTRLCVCVWTADSDPC